MILLTGEPTIDSTLRAIEHGVFRYLLKPISLDQLEEDFQMVASKDPQPELHLSPDSHVKYDIVAKVLAAAQRNHMAKIGFVNTSQFVEE